LHSENKYANIFPMTTDVSHRNTWNNMQQAGGQHGRENKVFCVKEKSGSGSAAESGGGKTAAGIRAGGIGTASYRDGWHQPQLFL
jgi:hypothetical protein